MSTATSELDALCQRLEDWRANALADYTLITESYFVSGSLSAASALLEQGVFIPSHWLNDQIEWANTIMETT